MTTQYKCTLCEEEITKNWHPMYANAYRCDCGGIYLPMPTQEELWHQWREEKRQNQSA